MRQADFRAALLDPSRPHPPGLTDPQGRPAGRRFNVYRNNVTVSLVEALKTAFPVLRKLVGEEFFAAMALEHVRAHPPRSPLLMLYGTDMPDFLARFPPVSHLPYLPDIARLELALRESYHAADATPVAPDRLAAIPPQDLANIRLRLAPALRLVRSDWPIHAIWVANMKEAPPPRTVTAQDILILRPEFDPEPHLLPQGAAPFIAALAEGKTIGTALDAAGDFDLNATFALLVSGGAIIDIATETSA
ncbi:putative DNA-binding protein [Albidovulum inexpectatum]|uniref:Putative DNA-binding protein n=1 Tax=Albidovulum inexpectatum TaxID=196587 RepID=A0A2S5JFC0_9RHOB|nr:DNA-binding domain-containing protein [Albidovulum inexpectatum]PPB80173.1 putative DNA-binding protein [Albidovulum inexpectatum]